MNANNKTITVTPPKFSKYTKDDVYGNYAKGDTKPFSICAVRTDGKQLKLKLPGTLFMLPMRNEHSEYGVKYSVGVEFNATDLEVLDNALDQMAAHLDENWEPKPVHDDGKIFLSLKPKAGDKEFAFDTNVPIRPLHLAHDKIEQFMDVTVEVAIAGWYRTDDDVNKYGLTLQVRKITWGEEPKKTVRKRKVEDEVRPPTS